MVIVTVFIVHWYLAIFTHALFYHRYAAHGMWQMSKFWERVFYMLAFVVHGSSYLSANAYGVMHRLHHEHVDTEQDPHAPKHSGNIMGFMVKTRNNYINIFHKKTALDAKYRENLPSWESFEKIAHNWVTRVLWIALYTMFYYYFATAWWQWLFLPLTITMGPTQGAIINWFSHKIGYRNYDTNDDSTNLMPFDLLLIGESYHHNHHAYTDSPNMAHKWWEFDISYGFIWLFDKIGIFRIRKSDEKLNVAKRSSLHLPSDPLFLNNDIDLQAAKPEKHIA